MSFSALVNVYCDDQIHDGERWVVATFGAISADATVEGIRAALHLPVYKWTLVAGSRKISRVDQQGNGKYTRFNLHCKECRSKGRSNKTLTLPIHMERLSPILDTLAEKGRFDIRLTELAAIIRSSVTR